jgi:hypothetical protein
LPKSNANPQAARFSFSRPSSGSSGSLWFPCQTRSRHLVHPPPSLRQKALLRQREKGEK